MTADPKCAARIVNRELLALIGLEHDSCEVTGRMGPLHLHHVLFRSQGGSDVRNNILVVHSNLHHAYHQGDRNAQVLIGQHVRDHRPDVLQYITSKTTAGYAEAWLERHIGGTA